MRRHKAIHHELDTRVWFDDNPGVIVAALESGREGSDDYLVYWDSGSYSIEWGSDLTVADGYGE